MPPSRSKSSQPRTSPESQNSMSPTNPNEPVTPPETSIHPQNPMASSDHYSHGQYIPRPPRHSCPGDTFGAGASGMGYSPSMLMPPPSNFPGQYSMAMQPIPGSSFSPIMSSPLGSHESPYSEYYGSTSQFGSYPQPYPYPAYHGGVSMSQTMSHQSTNTSYSGINTDTEAEEGFASMLNVDVEDEDYRQSSAEPNSLQSPSKTLPFKAQPPRPPNAWILYRSDQLKAISAGRKVKGLDDVMRKSGLSSSSGEESSAEALTSATSVSTTGTDEEKPVIRRKGKKGAKEPTEGLLKLGKGKTGRGLPQAHISKMISELWKGETAAVRGEYERRSELKKLEHAEKYPDYKFQPMRKADRVKAKEERDREKQAIKREKEAKAAARPRKNGSRSRPATATSPYSSTQRSISRSISMHAIQASSNMLQQAGEAPLPSPSKNFRAFPMSGDSLPSLQQYSQMGPPLATTSLQSSCHPSPTRTPAPSSTQLDQSMPPPPVPAHTMVYDPALYQQEQYQYQQPHVPEYQAGPSYTITDVPYYYDVNGTGAEYALPVIFNPPTLPDGQNLDDLPLEYSGNVEDLVAQWVTLERETGEGETEPEGEWTMQAPDLAVSDWGNLAPEAQEQIFADLDLSHTMAVHLTPDLVNQDFYGIYNNHPIDQTPLIDYNTGYISYPVYETTTPYQESGPFLYMPQAPSPDPTTPRQATFARNPSNIFQSTEEDRRVSTTSTSAQIPTRYVSNSQFPETPLSVDPSGLGTRRPSHVLDDEDDNGDREELDDYDWAAQDESENEQEPEVVVKKLDIPTKPVLLSSPISPLDSNIQPLDVPVSVSPQKGPPRGQRRARTVAGSYN